MQYKEPYRDTDSGLADGPTKDILSADVVSYHRTTCRFDKLVLTFLEDGSINLKRGNETFNTSAKEMYEVCTLAQSLRNFRREIGTAKLLRLDEQTTLQRETNTKEFDRLETYYTSERKSILDEYGV